MRAFLGATLGVIAIGVLLIAYGVFNPRCRGRLVSGGASNLRGTASRLLPTPTISPCETTRRSARRSCKYGASPDSVR